MSRRVSNRLRLALLALSMLGALTAFGGILPEQLGKSKRGPVTVEQPADPVLDEYGFDAGEQASYGPLKVTAWRFKDSTGSMAAFQYVRPEGAKASKWEKLAVTTGSGLLATHGNYLFRFDGPEPTEDQYNQLLFHLPRIEQSNLPVISTYLPPEGLIPNSERFITGPVALEKFDPGVSPSTAAFHLSTEAQYGRYRSKSGGEMNLAIFAYPTPSIARERSDEFRKVAGAVVKRTGSLVVLTVNPPNSDEAERLLAKINYEAQLTWNEKPKENIVLNTAEMLLSIMKLAGIVMVFCVLSGLMVAGIRMYGRRGGKGNANDAMITLHLQSK